MAATLPTDRILLADPPRDLTAIASIDSSLLFPTFTSSTAWSLGCLLHSRLLAYPQPCVISIALANNSQQLFYSCTHSGTTPDNDAWVARKRKTVLRWGNSTWFMHNKFEGNEAAFGAKYALGASAGEYAIHGGGWPVRVKGVEGIVAVVVVSGLKQHEDHQMIVQTVTDYLEGVEGVELEKKKED